MVMNLSVMILIILIINYMIFEYLTLFNSSTLFECGFDVMYWIHPKLSIHFFKMGIIFILFDLELILLLLCFTDFPKLIWVLLIFIYWTIFLELALEGFKWTL